MNARLTVVVNDLSHQEICTQTTQKSHFSSEVTSSRKSFLPLVCPQCHLIQWPPSCTATCSQAESSWGKEVLTPRAQLALAEGRCWLFAQWPPQQIQRGPRAWRSPSSLQKAVFL